MFLRKYHFTSLPWFINRRKRTIKMHWPIAVYVTQYADVLPCSYLTDIFSFFFFFASWSTDIRGRTQQNYSIYWFILAILIHATTAEHKTWFRGQKLTWHTRGNQFFTENHFEYVNRLYSSINIYLIHIYMY